MFGISSVSTDNLNGYAWGNTTVYFFHSPPLVYYDENIELDFRNDNSSICTNSGELLMYTNGMQVHSFDHVSIPNLDTIGFGPYWKLWVLEDEPEIGDIWYSGIKVTQNSIILPLDKEESRYMIIYQVREVTDVSDTKLQYSIVEHDAATELFGVIEKDVVFFNDRLKIGRINVCQHANGRDWWLIQQNDENTERYVFLINSQGIEHTQMASISESVPDGTSFSQSYYSPLGDFYAVSEVHDNGNVMSVQLYSFNRCIGNTEYIMSDTINVYKVNSSLAFSPSGQFMYVSIQEFMYQYDTWSDDIKSSRTTISEFDGYIFKYNEFDPGVPTEFGLMAHDPDGKVYTVAAGNNRFLHTIEYPDEKVTEANIIQRSITLNTSNFVGIPNLPHYRMGPLDGSNCDTLGLDNHPIANFRYEQDSMDHLNIRFTDNSYYRPENWTWDFGDATIYEGKRPYYHTYAADGEYDICLTVRNENSTNTHCKALTIGTTSTSDLSQIAKTTIYPNPVVDHTTLQLHEYMPEKAYIELYDASGSLVRKHRIYHGWNPLDLSKLNTGAYLYRMVDKDKFITKGALVKL